MQLYNYAQSSSSYRVRIALAIKELSVQLLDVDLRKGEQHLPTYLTINPQGLVPAFFDGEHTLTQSLAIIEYLEERHPRPPLLPKNHVERARVRAIAYAIACEISPINNLGVRNYIKTTYQASEEAWVQHWMHRGLQGVEKMLSESSYTGHFCHGNTPTMADCVLVPQIFNATRFKVDLADFPTITRINDLCEQHPAFKYAHPSHHLSF